MMSEVHTTKINKNYVKVLKHLEDLVHQQEKLKIIGVTVQTINHSINKKYLYPTRLNSHQNKFH